MNLLKKLPKYKKQWEKTRAIEPLIPNEDNGIYLIITNYDPITHNGIVEKKIIRQMNTEQQTHNHHYFFEIFKYLKKYQSYNSGVELVFAGPSASGRNGRWIAINRVTEKEMLKTIYKHLLNKKAKQNSFYKNLSNIKGYNDFLTKVFTCLKGNTQISLVIQKKIGYKYYEIIEYK